MKIASKDDSLQLSTSEYKIKLKQIQEEGDPSFINGPELSVQHKINMNTDANSQVTLHKNYDAS